LKLLCCTWFFHLPSRKKGDPLKSIPLVILGASAGGLDAFELFFKHFDSFDDAAILLIQHFSPDSVSMLPELMERRYCH